MLKLDDLRAVLALRAGLATRRFHCYQAVAPESVAAHSAGVALILVRWHPAPSAALLTAALTHDLGEYRVGDVPSPTKGRLQLGEQLAALEEEVLAADRWPLPTLTAEEAHWLQVADWLDGAFYALDELMRGNLVFEAPFIGYVGRLAELRATPETEGLLQRLGAVRDLLVSLVAMPVVERQAVLAQGALATRHSSGELLRFGRALAGAVG